MQIPASEAQNNDVLFDATWVYQYLTAGTNGMTVNGFYCAGIAAPVAVPPTTVLTLAIRNFQLVTD